MGGLRRRRGSAGDEEEDQQDQEAFHDLIIAMSWMLGLVDEGPANFFNMPMVGSTTTADDV